MEMFALESIDAAPGQLEGLIDKIKSTGQVKRDDVQPFIKHFPVTVGLHHFTEEDSEAGAGVALEGFAALFSAWMTGSQGVQLGNLIDAVDRAVPKLGTAVANNTETKLLGAMIVKKAPVQKLSKTDHEMGRVQIGKLQSVFGKGFPSPDGQVSLSLPEGRTALLEAFSLSLQAGCTGLTEELLREGARPVTKILSKMVREYGLELSRRLDKVTEIVSTVEEVIGYKTVDVIGDEIREQIKSPRREQLLIAIEGNYDSVLPPADGEGQYLIGSGRNDGRYLSARTKGLLEVYEDRQQSPFSSEAIEKLNAAVLDPDETSELFQSIMQRSSTLAYSVAELEKLLSDVRKFRDSTVKQAMPPQVLDALNDFLLVTIGDVEAVTHLVDIFQVEAVTYFVLTDRFQEAQCDLTDLVGVYFMEGEEPFITHDDKALYLAQLKAADSGKMVTESIRLVVGMAAAAGIVALLGAAVFFIRKMASRRVPAIKEKAISKMENYTAAAEQVFSELAARKHGADLTEDMLRNVRSSSRFSVLEVPLTTGKLDWTSYAQNAKLNRMQAEMAVGSWPYLANAIGKTWADEVGSISELFSKSIFPDLEDITKGRAKAPGDLRTPKDSFFNRTGENLRRGLTSWNAHAKAKGDVGSKEFADNIRNAYSEAAASLPSGKVVSLNGAIDRSARTAIESGQAELGRMISSLDSVEKALTRFKGKEAPDAALISALREQTSKLRKYTEELDSVVVLLSLEIRNLNELGKEKAGFVKNSLSRLVECTRSMMHGDSTTSHQSMYNGRLDGLITHVRSLLKKTEGMAVEDINDQPLLTHFADLYDGFEMPLGDDYGLEGLLTDIERKQVPVTESMGTAAKVIIGVGIVAVFGAILFYVARIVHQRRQINKIRVQLASLFKQAEEDLAEDLKRPDFAETLRAAEEAAAESGRAYAEAKFGPRTVQPTIKDVQGERLDVSPSQMTRNQDAVDAGIEPVTLSAADIADRIKAQNEDAQEALNILRNFNNTSLGSYDGRGGRGVSEVRIKADTLGEVLRGETPDFLTALMLEGKYQPAFVASERLLPRLMAVRYDRLSDAVAAVQDHVAGKIDADKMFAAFDSIVLGQADRMDNGGQFIQVPLMHGLEHYGNDGKPMVQWLHSLGQYYGLDLESSAFITQFRDKVVNRQYDPSEFDRVKWVDCGQLLKPNAADTSSLSKQVEAFGKLQADIEVCKKKLEEKGVGRGVVKRVKAYFDAERFHLAMITSILDVIEEEYRAFDRASNIMGRTSSTFVKTALKELRKFIEHTKLVAPQIDIQPLEKLERVYRDRVQSARAMHSNAA